MAFLRDQPQPKLTTQRVPGGRGAALIVGVVAVLVVGTLLWKPWDSGPPAAPPVPTFPRIASATTSPGMLAPSTAEPIPTTAPEDNPSGAPATPYVGFASLLSEPGKPLVGCVYRSSHGGPPTLRKMIVSGPYVVVSSQVSGNAVHSIGWQADIEVNDLPTVFSAEWRPVTHSRPEHYAVDPDNELAVDSVTVAVDPNLDEQFAVFRAVIAVSWDASDGDSLLQQRVTATSYGSLVDPRASQLAEGCPLFAPAET